MFDFLMPISESRFLRSVWPLALFNVLFSVDVSSRPCKIGKLDLVLERVVQQEPYT